jgi:predicted Zn-dependent peptidase
MRWGGYWTAQAGTGPERTARVVPLVEKEVRAIAERTIPTAELELIRESAIGEIPLALETAADAHELAVYRSGAIMYQRNDRRRTVATSE